MISSQSDFYYLSQFSEYRQLEITIRQRIIKLLLEKTNAFVACISGTVTSCFGPCPKYPEFSF